MKLLALIILLITFTAHSASEIIKPRNWQPIIGVKKSSTLSLFFDKNNHTVTQLEKGEYISGSILFASSVEVMVEIDGKKIPTKSMVKNYIVDCDSGLALAYSDYFFSVEKPNIVSKPVASLLRGMDSAETFLKSSLIYKIFCPTYI